MYNVLSKADCRTLRPAKLSQLVNNKYIHVICPHARSPGPTTQEGVVRLKRTCDFSPRNNSKPKELHLMTVEELPMPSNLDDEPFPQN